MEVTYWLVPVCAYSTPWTHISQQCFSFFSKIDSLEVVGVTGWWYAWVHPCTTLGSLPSTLPYACNTWASVPNITLNFWTTNPVTRKKLCLWWTWLSLIPLRCSAAIAVGPPGGKSVQYVKDATSTCNTEAVLHHTELFIVCIFGRTSWHSFMDCIASPACLLLYTRKIFFLPIARRYWAAFDYSLRINMYRTTYSAFISTSYTSEVGLVEFGCCRSLRVVDRAATIGLPSGKSVQDDRSRNGNV